MNLFDHARDKVLEKNAPLAARMRPRTLEEYFGQRHVLGPGRLLRRAIQADQLSSLIFYGPPGTGKTTLARIIANTTRAHFTALNAVLAGVADLRAAVADAQTLLGEHARRTILFVDEVHRFNKAQQDALLPHVENGTVTLIGATTENPYFEVNKPLVSRSRIFELKPLDEDDIRGILSAAVSDQERGYGRLKVRLEEEALAHLAHVANGDARAALNALELAVETTPPGEDGSILIGLAVAEESIQRRAVLYDKEGDAHFDAISAFIKSLRGSDPDAALYWMARMVYAGEDPRFILRRMIVFAAEDVGLADPGALRVVMSAAQAYDYVGMPEGRFHLAEACLYLSTAPKSNSAFAFFDALAAVEKERSGEVPDHLKDANRDAEGLGHGLGYLYPHSYREHWVAQQYLPDNLQGRVFYEPGELGFEESLRLRVQRNREAALAAWQEREGTLGDHFPGGHRPGGHRPGGQSAISKDIPKKSRRGEEWAARGQGAMGEQLGVIRDRIFELARIKREHLVLDANAGSGLLTFEAIRRAAEGGVWARVDEGGGGQALREGILLLPSLAAPLVVEGPLESLPERIARTGEESGRGAVRFDRILARNALTHHPPAAGLANDATGRNAAGSDTAAGKASGKVDKTDMPDKMERIAMLAGLLAPGGEIVLAERAPGLGERLLASLDWSGLPKALANKAIEAEEAIYSDPGNPLVNWDGGSLEQLCGQAGLLPLTTEVLRRPVDLTISPRLLADWFGPEPTGKQGKRGGKGNQGKSASSGGKLSALLGEDSGAVRAFLERVLTGAPVRRTIAIVLLVARRQ